MHYKQWITNMVMTLLIGSSMACATLPKSDASGSKATFHLLEAKIDDVHTAMKSGQITCRGLVQLYLDRIAAYNGTSVQGKVVDGLMIGDVKPIPGVKQLNALIHINPKALEIAGKLDASLASTGKLSGPLHCIPFAVKDAIDSAEMLSTSGSAMPFVNPVAPDDATVVERLRNAGAIILAKANLDEFGRGSSGRSTLGGQTSNPYDTTRIPGGSSGGCGAAVAANLVMVALAEETGVSIRNPASNNNIVGIAPTQGLVSRDGVIPISFTQDRIGPYARTVKDAAKILEVIAGYDPKDPATAASKGRVPERGYERFVDSKGLAGARLGLVRQFMTAWTPADKESVQIAEKAIEDMKKSGAEVMDVSAALDKALAELLPYLDPAYLPLYYKNHADFPFNTDFLIRSFGDPGFSSTLLNPAKFPNFGIAKTLSDARTNDHEMRYSFNRYLLLRGDSNIRTLDDVINKPPKGSSSATGVFFAKDFKDRLIQVNAQKTLNDPAYIERILRRRTHQEVVLKVMEDHKLDALVYPMKTIPANTIGTRTAPSPPEAGYRPESGNILSSQTGFPSIIVPAGFTTVVYDWVPDPADSKKTILGAPVRASVPVAMEFLGVPFSESVLLKLAAGYENATRHRRPPADFPPLSKEP